MYNDDPDLDGFRNELCDQIHDARRTDANIIETTCDSTIRMDTNDFGSGLRGRVRGARRAGSRFRIFRKMLLSRGGVGFVLVLLLAVADISCATVVMDNRPRALVSCVVGRTMAVEVAPWNGLRRSARHHTFTARKNSTRCAGQRARMMRLFKRVPARTVQRVDVSSSTSTRSCTFSEQSLRSVAKGRFRGKIRRPLWSQLGDLVFHARARPLRCMLNVVVYCRRTSMTSVIIILHYVTEYCFIYILFVVAV